MFIFMLYLNGIQSMEQKWVRLISNKQSTVPIYNLLCRCIWTPAKEAAWKCISDFSRDWSQRFPFAVCATDLKSMLKYFVSYNVVIIALTKLSQE